MLMLLLLQLQLLLQLLLLKRQETSLMIANIIFQYYLPALEQETVRVIIRSNVEVRLGFNEARPPMDDILRAFGRMRRCRFGPNRHDRVQVPDSGLAPVVAFQVIVDHLPQDVFGVSEPLTLRDGVD